MSRKDENLDPYAPPPRYKQRSGAMLRVAILAGLLGAAGWGYMHYSQQPQQALVEPAIEETRVADSGYDTGYEVDPVAPAPTTGAPAAPSDTPAEPPEPASSEPAPSDPPA
jgi:hypothetical protein